MTNFHVRCAGRIVRYTLTILISNSVSSKPIKELEHIFFSRPSRKAGRELQTVSNTRMRIMEDHPERAGAGHRAVSLHRGCVLVLGIASVFNQNDLFRKTVM